MHLSSFQFLSKRAYSSGLSYTHTVGSRSLLFESIGQHFRRSVERTPDKELLVHYTQGIRKTYSQVFEDSQRLATGLIHLGLKRGDRIGIYGPTSYEWVTTQLAAAHAGFVLSTINPAYKAHELEFVLERAGVRALVMQKEHRKADYYGTLAEIIPSIKESKAGVGETKSTRLSNLEHVIVIDKATSNGAWEYEEIVKAGTTTDEKALAALHLQPDDAAMILFTSGTTGKPKPAALSHFGLVNNADIGGRHLHYNEGSHRLCVAPPLFHVLGIQGVLGMMSCSQTVVFPDYSFNAVNVLRALAEEKFVPLTVRTSADARQSKARQRCLICGAPCPLPLGRRLVNELGLRDLVTAFGATEGNGLVTVAKLCEPLGQRLAGVGYPIEHVEAVVVNGNGEVVSREESGELLVRGSPVAFLGYYKDEEATRSAVTPSGWYRTGDVARMNDDGSLSIVGRIKDMVIRGGENIYPAEIEQFFHSLDFVAEVFGVPDERYGEELCAWIRPRPAHEKITPEEIRKQCNGKIAHYKIPRYISIKREDEFPRTPIGKAKKQEMAEIATRELRLKNDS